MRSFLRFALVGILNAASVLSKSLDSRQQQQQPKTPIDATIYANLVNYTAYPAVAHLLANETCSNPPPGSVIEKYINYTPSDTQLAVFRQSTDKEIVVGIPGSTDIQDAITDFLLVPVPYISPGIKCDGCLVHLGFLSAWNSVVNQTVSVVQGLLGRYPYHEVVVTGASLGGALAQLAFATMKEAGLPIKGVYTYGQPRVGNVKFADYIDSLAGANENEAGIYYRVTHQNDGVPQLPPTLGGVWWHSQAEYWESAEIPSLTTTYRCYGQEPADCINQAGGFGVNPAHTGYAGLNYTCSP